MYLLILSNHYRLKIIVIFSQSFFKNSNAIGRSVFLKIQVRISAFMINIARLTVVMSKKKRLSNALCHYVYLSRFLMETGTTIVVSYVLKKDTEYGHCQSSIKGIHWKNKQPWNKKFFTKMFINGQMLI